MEARLSARRKRAMLAMSAFLLVAAAPLPALSPAFERAVSDIRADMLADPVTASGRANRLLGVANSEIYPSRRALMMATAQWLAGEAYVRQGKPELALSLLREAEGLAAKHAPGSLLLADILLAKGSALTDAARVTESLTTLQRAHALYVSLDQARGQAKALILMAMLYDAGRDHQNALRYFRQAQDAYASDKGLLIAIYSGQGSALEAVGKFEQAEREFAAVLTIARDMKATAAVALTWGYIANVRLRAGRLAAAEAAIRQGQAVAQNPAAISSRPQLTRLAAAVAFARGDVAGAEVLLDDLFEGVDLSRTVIADRDAHDTAYRVYLARGRVALALRHLAALKRLDDQATQIARSTSAALAAARFDYANQELRIAKLKATDLARTVAFERASARTQWRVFVASAIGTALVIALLAFGLFTIRRSRNHVRAANADLATTNGKLEKALAAKTEFLATTSHEIRTPLNGILGMTQVMIADRALDPALRERLAVVHGAGTTMRALVDDILDVAKIETGRMTVEQLPIDLIATVEDAARIWHDAALAKGLAFDSRCDLSARWALGDAARLRQIVFNLLSNAVKFTATGGIVMTLEDADGRMRLSVADTGIGIPGSAHELIFESFRQAYAGTTRQFGGTGLGLSICRNLARAMDGDVTVASRAGEGATFLLDLPLLPAEAPGTTMTAAGLLVVERNPINRAMFASLFAALDPVVFADDAEEAVRLIAGRTPARLLVDAGSLGGDDPPAAARRVIDAAGERPVSILIPAGSRDTWSDCGVAQLLERPIGKRALVMQVTSDARSLVPEAA